MTYYSSVVSCQLGLITLFWLWDEEWKIVRIGLPSQDLPGCDPIMDDRVVRSIEKKIILLLEGQEEEIPFDHFDFSSLTPWHRQVLFACRKIPRGFVCSYQSLALHLRMKKGARAIGWAMAHNPFPLVIPCHRVIRSDGSLGGYGGGAEWKKKLLLQEGVIFLKNGLIDKSFFISP